MRVGQEFMIMRDNIMDNNRISRKLYFGLDIHRYPHSQLAVIERIGILQFDHVITTLYLRMVLCICRYVRIIVQRKQKIIKCRRQNAETWMRETI